MYHLQSRILLREAVKAVGVIRILLLLFVRFPVLQTGLPGEEFNVTLELKLLADVGLVGFPNVGKSTLVSVVSQAKPLIANYHFTTITPVLGVVSMGEVLLL